MKRIELNTVFGLIFVQTGCLWGITGHPVVAYTQWAIALLFGIGAFTEHVYERKMRNESG